MILNHVAAPKLIYCQKLRKEYESKRQSQSEIQRVCVRMCVHGFTYLNLKPAAFNGYHQSRV